MMCVCLNASTELIAYIKQCLSTVMYKATGCAPRVTGVNRMQPPRQQLCNKNSTLQLKISSSRLDFRASGSPLLVDANSASQRGLAQFKYRVLLISWVRTQDRLVEGRIGENPPGVGGGEGGGKDDTLAPPQAYLDSVALLSVP